MKRSISYTKIAKRAIEKIALYESAEQRSTSEKESDVRVIGTGLFTKHAYDIISSVFGQLSDGWGENSPALIKWWRYADAKRSSGGEVTIEISNEYSRRYKYDRRPVFNAWRDLRSDMEVLNQIAKWIKKTIYMEIRDSLSNSKGVWRRDNTEFKSEYFHGSDEITIQDIYIVVDVLTGKFNPKKYPPEAIKRVVGK